MATYKLESDPKVFITPNYYDNKFVYRMVSIEGESNRRVVRQIDLRKDKLVVYGTAVDDSMLQKLYNSLILRPKSGIVYVNCDGECYINVVGKGTFRPINNVIFDWSSFSVIVPNSLSDSLRKKMVEKEEEVHRLKSRISASEAEALSSKASLDESRKEIDELKQQLSSTISELEATKGLVELSEKREVEHKNEITALRKEREEMDIKLREAEDRLSSVESELRSTQIQIETSSKSLEELENKLANSRKEVEAKDTELRRAKNEQSRVQSKPVGKRLTLRSWFQRS